MRKALVLATLLIALVWANPARAVIGTADNVPAATLLFPYFEVDPAVSGVTTLIAIHNSSASATLVHVTLWTDLGIPTFAFDVYLTGYDVQTINLRDIFVSWYLGQTASDGQDPADQISPQGLFSADMNFSSCNGILPYANPALDAAQRAHLQAWHRGDPSPTTSTCAGFNYGGTILRGYVTADISDKCSSALPGDAGYFVAPVGPDPYPFPVAGLRNTLFGDYFVVDQGNNFMEADRAVAIEADVDHPATNGASDYTFYGRMVGWSGADHREALPNLWGARYLTEGSSYRVWRDPGVAPPSGGFSCGLPYPAGFPLDSARTVAFDAQENPLELVGTYFPYAVFEVDVDAAGVPATAKQGWMYLKLDSLVSVGPPPGFLRQSWVTVKQQTQGRFSASWPAVQLGTPANGSRFVLSGT